MTERAGTAPRRVVDTAALANLAAAVGGWACLAAAAWHLVEPAAALAVSAAAQFGWVLDWPRPPRR